MQMLLTAKGTWIDSSCHCNKLLLYFCCCCCWKMSKFIPHFAKKRKKWKKCTTAVLRIPLLIHLSTFEVVSLFVVVVECRYSFVFIRRKFESLILLNIHTKCVQKKTTYTHTPTTRRRRGWKKLYSFPGCFFPSFHSTIRDSWVRNGMRHDDACEWED